MEKGPLICHAYQWICFYMTRNIVMELTNALIKVTNVSFVSKHAKYYACVQQRLQKFCRLQRFCRQFEKLLCKHINPFYRIIHIEVSMWIL